MDILAHTLWTNAGARAANKFSQKKKKKLHIHPGWAAFWGVFPDFFAFTIPFIIAFLTLFKGTSLTTLSNHHGLVAGLDIAQYLYQFSHSLVIWALVFLTVWFFSKRPRFELLGWALHILIDIPSHTIGFYPTPFLFPISEYRFPYGISWGNSWYMIINYSALALIWIPITIKSIRKKHDAREGA